ncbi:MAG: hypothetical protein PF436_00470 [Prolixibacteraceae bacterium]|jgi:hypothetical protein|nr:hypothetical protein [Prolixibacteraceae bacterium]
MAAINFYKSVFYKSYTSLLQYNLPRVKISRHLYDIERLMNTEHAENALADKKLYNEIIQHRMVYTKQKHAKLTSDHRNKKALPASLYSTLTKVFD